MTINSSFNYYGRAFKVWFLTIFSGTFMNLFLDTPLKSHSLTEGLANLLVMQLFTIPVFFLTVPGIFLCYFFKWRRARAAGLFLAAVLTNLFTWLVYRRMLGDTGMNGFLLPYCISSFPFMFLVNRDWLKVNERPNDSLNAK